MMIRKRQKGMLNGTTIKGFESFCFVASYHIQMARSHGAGRLCLSGLHWDDDCRTLRARVAVFINSSHEEQS